MKRLAFCILVALALTACAPAVPQTQTSEVPPTGTMSETSEVLPTSTPLPPATAKPPTINPEPTPTQATNMTYEKWIESFKGGIYISPINHKEYKTEEMIGNNNYLFLKYSNNQLVDQNGKFVKLQDGIQLMILEPSGEIIIWANPDEAVKRAAEGAIIVIPNLDNTRNNAGSITNAFRVALISAFRQWEIDNNSSIHIQFGEYDADKMSPMIISIDEIPLTADNDCPILEMPKFFTVFIGDDILRSEEAGIIDPVNWLKQLISKGGSGFKVYPNKESYNSIP